MSSSSQSNGTASIAVTFRSGTDINVALMDVQNRLRRVEARLPEEVRRQGVQVVKANAGFLMIVALTSKTALDADARAGQLRRRRAWSTSCAACPAWATCARSPPSTRCASGSTRPSSRASTVRRPTRSPRCRSRTASRAGGSLGDRPLAEKSEINATILTQSRFTHPRAVRQHHPARQPGRLGHPARRRRARRARRADYGFDIEMNGKPAAGMAIQLTPGANALAVADAVKQRMAELAVGFPPDIALVGALRLDAVHQRVGEVGGGDADRGDDARLPRDVPLPPELARHADPDDRRPDRALPARASASGLLGFSINVLTLFAMVHGDRHSRRRRDRRDRERRAHHERGEALAVRRDGEGDAPDHLGRSSASRWCSSPCSCRWRSSPASTGGIYRQFSVTLAISIAFSALHGADADPGALRDAAQDRRTRIATGRRNRVARVGGRFFGGFNGWFARTTGRYQGVVGRILVRPLRFLAIFVALVAITLAALPAPARQLPPHRGSGRGDHRHPGAARRDDGAHERRHRAGEGVLPRSSRRSQTNILVRGFSFFGQGQANAIAFVRLKPWEERQGEQNSAQALVAHGARRAVDGEGSDGVHAQSAGDPGARRGERIQLRARGSQRPHAPTS